MKRKLAGFGILIVLASLIAGSTMVLASENQKELSIIAEGQKVEGDYIKANNHITNRGTVTGDFIVAGNEISHEGAVEGDLIAAAAELALIGSVRGDIRVLAGEVLIEGEVDRNATLMGDRIIQYKDSTISGSIHAISRELEIRGAVGGDIRGANENTIISGTVKGNVFVHTNNIYVAPGALIEGNLVYVSEAKQSINPQQVKGMIEHRLPKGAGRDFADQLQSTVKTTAVVSRVVFLVSYLLAGILLIMLFKKPYDRASLIINERPWHSIGLGVSAVICIPVAAVILFVTIIGIPFGLAALALYGILLYIAKIPVGIWLGSKIFRGEKRQIVCFIIGTLILEAVSMIPRVGWLASFVTLAAGAGATIIMLKRYYKKELGDEGTIPPVH